MATEFNNNSLIVKDLSATNLIIGPESLANSFYISENGNVGINTDDPNETLSVDGNLSLSGDFFVTGNSVINQLLEVDVIRANTYLNLSGESIQRAITNLTYAELTGNISSKTLQPGEYYRITDFVTEYISNAGEWISPNNSAFVSANSGTPLAISAIAATPEPLIVLALNSNKIGSYAYSELWPYDIIQYDPNLTLLKNKDNTYRSKGFIIYREDTINRIACDYDWRNIRFKRWSLAPLSGTNPILNWVTSTTYEQFDLVTNSSIVYVCLSAHTSTTFTTDYNNGRWIGVFGINGGLVHRPDGLQIQDITQSQWTPVLPIGNQNLTYSPKLTAVYGGTAQAGYFSTIANTVNGNNSITSYNNPGNIYNFKIRKGVISSSVLNSGGYSVSLPDIVFLANNTSSATTLIDIDIQGNIGGSQSNTRYDELSFPNTFYRLATGIASGTLSITNFKVTNSNSRGFANNIFRIGAAIKQIEINCGADNRFRNNIGTLERFTNIKITKNVINNIFDQNIIDNNINGEFHSNFIQNGFHNNNIHNNFCSNILNRNFQNNTINASVSTSTYNDLLTASHIYNSYTCNIIQNTNLETKLTYLTDTGSITAVNVNN
jgi:hypothetical protein